MSAFFKSFHRLRAQNFLGEGREEVREDRREEQRKEGRKEGRKGGREGPNKLKYHVFYDLS